MKQILLKLQQLVESEMVEKRRENPDSSSISGCVTYQKHSIMFYVHDDGYKEFQVDRNDRTCFCENIEEWLTNNTLDLADIDAESEDMWNCHGFRDSQDYINYRYR